MGIGEVHPTGGELVDVRGLGLGMSAEVSGPVIEVVDDNDEEVGLGGLGGYGQEKEGEEAVHGSYGSYRTYLSAS